MIANKRGPAVIYKITNRINGHFYIGVTSRELALRFREHIIVATRKRANGRFQRAIRKYGADAFFIEPLKTVATLGEAKAKEIEEIAILRPQYNSTKGGDGALGLTFTPEALRRIGEAHKGKRPRLGMTHTPEVKARLRESAKQNINMERWQQYRELGPKTSSKAVKCSNGTIYESASEAARFMGCSKSMIIEICRRNPRRATVKGFVFRYADDAGDMLSAEMSAKERKIKAIELNRKFFSKSVKCLTDGRIFSRTAEAAKAYGILPSQVAAVANGRRSHVHNLKFSYVGEK